MKNFNVIAAVAMNGVIGSSTSNAMPWHLPADLRHFKETTKGSTVVMGSKTFASIGKILPNRKNVVITRSFDLARKMLDVDRVHETYVDFESALKCEHDGFFAIGGGRIYREAFSFQPVQLFITIVATDAEGDVVFPIAGREFVHDSVKIGDSLYECAERSDWMSENGHSFQFTKFVLVK